MVVIIKKTRIASYIRKLPEYAQVNFQKELDEAIAARERIANFPYFSIFAHQNLGATNNAPRPVR